MLWQLGPDFSSWIDSSKPSSATIPRQYSGFGGSEEWRIQDAASWMPGNTVPNGKLCRQLDYVARILIAVH